jgi:subtilase family serine protease
MELSGVSINGTELAAGAPATIAAGEGVEVEVQAENQGESAENGVTVSVTVGGNTLQGEISSIEPGEVASVTIPLTPTPKGETTLEVEVEPVAGEQVTENNEASYTVTFE